MSVFEKNYFELFDLTVSFDINPELLAERFRNMQRLVHPDRYAAGSEQEKRMAVQLAARINDAYQSLKDPLQRARYMLQLADVLIDDEKNTGLDPIFLAQQMEKREQLAEIKETTDPLAGLHQLEQQAQRDENELLVSVGAAFARPGELLSKDIVALVKKLQFVRKLHDEIVAMEESL